MNDQTIQRRAYAPIAAVLGLVPGIGNVLGFIGGWVASAFIMKKIFKTTFGKALGAQALMLVFVLLLVGAIVLIASAMSGVWVKFELGATQQQMHSTNWRQR